MRRAETNWALQGLPYTRFDFEKSSNLSKIFVKNWQKLLFALENPVKIICLKISAMKYFMF